MVDLPKNLVFLLLWVNYRVSQRKRCFTLPRVELPRAALTHVNLELVGGKGRRCMNSQNDLSQEQGS